MVLGNAGNLPHCYVASQPKRPQIDGGSKVLQKAGILPHHCTSLHGITTQKTMTRWRKHDPPK